VEEFYLSAFHDLDTCRGQGWGPGPIPWDKIRDYAQHEGLEPDIARLFCRVIAEMDRGYVEWCAGEQKRETEMNRRAASRRK
jgi:hypothetical protein